MKDGAAGYAIFMHKERLPTGELCIVAEHPDLPGCTVYGDDEGEVRILLERARDLYLSDMRTRGETPPAPNAMGPSEVIWYSDLTPEPAQLVAA